MILGRADERRAALGDVAVAEVVIPDPAADAVARLEHDHRVTGARDLPGGRQPGDPRPDDDHVRVAGDARAAALGGVGGLGQRDRGAARDRRGDEAAACDPAIAHGV